MPTVAPADRIPVGPNLSMFDPVFLGLDEYGAPVYTPLAYRRLLIAGEPDGGKSSLINTVTAHIALCRDARPVLFDGKLVELGPWEDCADEFVGADMGHAITTLRRLQTVMNNRYAWLLAHGRRKLTRTDGVKAIASIFDEIALYATVLGTKAQQEEFITLFRDLVARGRAAAMPVIAATQRPSIDIIPKSLRDLFGYRAAFRCTSSGSSDIILGDGWSSAGFCATTIKPTTPGVCYLIAEGGVPALMKVAYLTDDDITTLADYAAWSRTGHHTTHPAPPAPASADALAA
ncbi:FtsK/SpoIIIE domain-containing protein [Actinomadura sp. 9N215]|uniref:FtsK/SpoIIIE domain-containing protein n=1 Tax=Actinomadura sp. 9N215 TaxID=3375150 RepID=UPI0037B45CB4